MSRQNALIVAALVLIVGFGVGYWFGGYQMNNSLRAQLMKYFPVPLPAMMNLSGTVEAVNGSTIDVTIAGSNNPFDEWPTARQVNVTAATVIVDNMATSTASSTRSLSDIKPGMSIFIDAGKNVKNSVSFDAKFIRIGIVTANPVGFPQAAVPSAISPPKFPKNAVTGQP